MINRIALGTVQFGLDYGVTNVSGIPTDEVLEKILNMANSKGVFKLDTAMAYGNAEERIGKFGNRRFQVITKVNGVKTVADLNTSVTSSLSNLKQDNIYALMFHDADEILKNHDLWFGANEIKSKGILEKVGYSLYSTQQLDELLSLDMVPDIVQVPFNILDRRFGNRFKMLKAKNVEIHVRSIFLQGLLLSKELRCNSRFGQWSETWGLLDEWILSKSLSPLEACLGHVQSYKEIDHIVVGVTDLNQFMEILSVAREASRRAPKNISINDLNLINPSNWK